MRIVQFANGDNGGCQVARVSEDGESLNVIADVESSYQLACEAIERGLSLAAYIDEKTVVETVDYATVIADGRLLPPLHHPDPAHMLVTGTGLTHLGSASTRDAMHEKVAGSETELTDSMKMFKWGLEGGKPAAGEEGVQPEWFYKGDGSWVVAPEQPLEMPAFALDGSEEPEIAALYIIGGDGTPYRVGYAITNEFSDHVMEQQNYLYLAHSKLRTCSFGPELLVGDLPAEVKGTSRILRDGEVMWEKPFVSGEANMSHSLDNLEQHHFKYPGFRRAGDVHCHFFGTATLSFADGIKTEVGDVFEISAEGFGKPLRNGLVRTAKSDVAVAQL